MQYHYTLPDSGNFSSLPPEPFGANYIVVENLDGYNGMMVFDFTGLSATVWGVAYTIDYGAGQYSRLGHRTDRQRCGQDQHSQF